jgi:hypothetical protein
MKFPKQAKPVVRHAEYSKLTEGISPSETCGCPEGQHCNGLCLGFACLGICS